MKVILCEDIENLGDMGETVKVADGYARNYLLPNRLAVAADSASAKRIEHEMRIIARKNERRRAELSEVASKLEAITVDIKMRAGEGDKLFGSVTNVHICDKLTELGFDVDRKKIKLAEPIKTLGIFQVPVRLTGGIEPSVKVWVTALAEPKAEPVVEDEHDDRDDERTMAGSAVVDEDED